MYYLVNACKGSDQPHGADEQTYLQEIADLLMTVVINDKRASL